MPPPAMTISASSIAAGAGKSPLRRRCPRATSAPSMEPDGTMGLERVQPMPPTAAIPVAPIPPMSARRTGSALAFIAAPFVREDADQRLVVEPNHRRRPARHVRRKLETAGGDAGRQETVIIPNAAFNGHRPR